MEKRILVLDGIEQQIVDEVTNCDYIRIGDSEFASKKEVVRMVGSFAKEHEKVFARQFLLYINENRHCLDYPSEDLLEYFFIHIDQ